MDNAGKTATPRSVFGAAYAGFMSWLSDEPGDLSPRLDGALRAMADAFHA